MARTTPFEKYADRYDDWFEGNRSVYQAELQAVGSLLPPHGAAVEIGVGTGRFAAPLGVRIGVEPSTAMAMIARQRGIQVVRAVAEALPFKNEAFDVALMITTVCFLDDVELSFREAHRVLRWGGCLLVGFINAQSHLGQAYQRCKAESRFYGEARFYTVDEVVSRLASVGFGEFTSLQAICDLSAGLASPEPIGPSGEGSFVVLRGIKSARAQSGERRRK